MTTPAIDSFRGQYRYLSNFAGPDEGCTNGVELDGVIYATSEHAYQAAKFAHLPAIARWIRQQTTPGKTKYEAAKFKARIRPDWQDVNIGIMRRILRSKFVRNPKLREALCSTGTAELIEGNTHGDRWWGQVAGVGENHLGKLLMELRGQLRAEDVGHGLVSMMGEHVAAECDAVILAKPALPLVDQLSRTLKAAAASNERLEQEEVRAYLDEATDTLWKLETLLCK